MIYKTGVITTLILALIYTVSYALFEYKNKNTPAAAGVCLLCAIVSVIGILKIFC